MIGSTRKSSILFNLTSYKICYVNLIPNKLGLNFLSSANYCADDVVQLLF